HRASPTGEVRVPVSASVDACPGVLTLHPARDGHVARIRLPGGYVSRAKWTALAELADELGDGDLDLTARGNVQLRGLPAAAGAELARRAAGAGPPAPGPHAPTPHSTDRPPPGIRARAPPPVARCAPGPPSP